MENLKDEIGFYPKDLERNWAATYAKRLFDLTKKNIDDGIDDAKGYATAALNEAVEAAADMDADTLSAAKEYAGELISPITDYREMPTQVGTWIDGTPIWRVAFEKNVNYTVVDIECSFADKTNVKIINAFAYDPAIEETYYEMVIKDDRFTFSHPSENFEQRTVTGFIEFATPKSNIIAEV